MSLETQQSFLGDPGLNATGTGDLADPVGTSSSHLFAEPAEQMMIDGLQHFESPSPSDIFTDLQEGSTMKGPELTVEDLFTQVFGDIPLVPTHKISEEDLNHMLANISNVCATAESNASAVFDGNADNGDLDLFDVDVPLPPGFYEEMAKKLYLHNPSLLKEHEDTSRSTEEWLEWPDEDSEMVQEEDGMTFSLATSPSSRAQEELAIHSPRPVRTYAHRSVLSL
ncbi:hypothetical protein EST38_g8184 [Candolleomyces aberdarensis]|uniref:Uncharacterized protein n=1 Tax=Candolleomyces aberdarensis TaxID=2316362 RepID=A0A4Q2DD72_9AGAR|nr:hypothetical protein EST38_g8184 [Candolleomyces aberdarensis]